MAVKVGATCLQWTQPIIPQSPSFSQTLASTNSSPSSKRWNRGEGGALVGRFVQRLDRSSLFGAPPTRIYRSRSFEYPFSTIRTIRRACSASLEESFSDEEFSKKIQEIALRFQLSDEDVNNNARDLESKVVSDSRDSNYNSFCEESSNMNSIVNFVHQRTENPLAMVDVFEPPWPESPLDQPDWPVDEIIPASIERKANSCDLPLSLRIIKRKLQWKEGFREAGELAYSSVKKAFSSMVFIIRELHSYTLQMREILFFEDLQEILSRVQKEMHASFVWLFQQVFSSTPTLMMYVMILLANFTVYSMGHNSAIAATPPTGSCAAMVETVSENEIQDQKHQKFDSSVIKRFSLSSSSGKMTSIGGNSGGGGKIRPVGSGTEGEGRFDRSENYRTVPPDGASQLSSPGTRDAESVSGQESREEELALWNSIVEEATKMQAPLRDGTLEHDTLQRFVSPVSAKIEAEDYTEYFRTELLYQTNLIQEPSNPLLLANYAQFLYLVAHDYDRAEEYFKRATGVEPPDAEAFNKYATFLWRGRNDLWGAEETYLEAIGADPTNSYYAANYAHFLWNTGGEDTCFPLSSPDTSQEV
ncbi:Tetratricopeptide repeat (TPR)-like superfamily protein [Quillaja saponaria]|uniref:Tetratricopeptide repeat (TPR)-like superfamily protein n=1 Tax=Quillaja saponaria TaxID=32244 RepID=A0AAD7LTR2_QUISA|nr:Tetratricopeptide repeat (TPR)-like superfamily protein [Quillaja saponaria]KAJ7964149.1 Tetratricopeptide repeat (TPR)-like superfamily protein [Quillaja saponaria]